MRSSYGSRAPQAALALTLGLLSIACSRGVEPDETAVANPGPPLNIVLVTIDTLRRDHLSCYGYFRKTSPNIDRLSKESLVFENLQSHVAQTLPSHTSLFTGLAPSEHGIESNIGYVNGSYILPPSIRTLASVLGEQGYQTAGFVSATPLKKGSGVEVGFQTWVEPEGLRTPGDGTVDAALEWLASEPAQPWFLWVHLFDPHHSYRAPKEFRIFGPSDEQNAHLAALGIPELVSPKPPKQIRVGLLHDQYDAEVLFTDHQIGRLLGRVYDDGYWSKTAVVITSDHGEGLWQHNILDHSEIWNEQLEIPLIVRLPGVAPRRVEGRMTGRDILPTLLGQLPGIDRAELLAQSSGVDLLADDFEAPPRFTIVPPMPLLQEVKQWKPPYSYALEHAGWRIIMGQEDHAELYDLTNDPHELNDLATVEPERLRKLRGMLEREHAKQLARRSELGAGQLGPMSQERLEALQALGYGGVVGEH